MVDRDLEQRPGPPPAPRRSGPPRAGVPLLPVLAAALVIAGGVGPWLRVRGVDVELFATDRTVASVAAGAAAVIVARGGRLPVRLGVASCGLACTGVCGYRFADLSVELSQIGWGLWVALAGSVVLLVTSARA